MEREQVMQAASYSQKYQDAATAAVYDREIYSDRSGSTTLWIAEQRVLGRLLKQYSPDHKAADALDFACGAGRIIGYLAPRVRALLGVDISQAMLALARRKVGPEVRLICADIVASPHAISESFDLITAFRFLLLAEPPLRKACVQVLQSKLRSDGVMILNSHGNPRSFRALASCRNKYLRGTEELPAFSITDMRSLADECGLKLVGCAGVGFLPGALYRVLPRGLCTKIESALARVPFLWRFGTNLFFILKTTNCSARPICTPLPHRPSE
jgi:SAM-dependent methyltransferase